VRLLTRTYPAGSAVASASAWAAAQGSGAGTGRHAGSALWWECSSVGLKTEWELRTAGRRPGCRGALGLRPGCAVAPHQNG
jgi:hypothetical protein